MAVRIRLRRIGAKKRPFYRVVVADSRSPRDGRFLDTVGWYDPLAQPARIEINESKALRWLSEGAEPTDSVRSLLAKVGIWRRHQGVEAVPAAGGGAAGAAGAPETAPSTEAPTVAPAGEAPAAAPAGEAPAEERPAEEEA